MQPLAEPILSRPTLQRRPATVVLGPPLAEAQTRTRTSFKAALLCSSAAIAISGHGQRKRLAVKALAPKETGALVSVSELPKVEALGVELRQTSGIAAPVNVQTGQLTGEPFRIRHELGPDTKKNIATVTGTLQQLRKHFGWNKVIGCSVTKALMENLTEDDDGDYPSRREKVQDLLRKSLNRRGQVAFFHVDIHTVGAGYHELVWGDSRSTDVWRKKTILVCTLGRNIGAVLFNDGRRVRHSPLNDLFTSSRHANLPSDAGDYKFVPPMTGTESFEEWVSLLDDYLAEIVESVPTGLGRLVLVPTGRIASADRCISEALMGSPRLAKTKEKAAERGADMVVAESEEEVNIVRGMALDAIFELQISQARRALDGVLHDSKILQHLSEVQLEAIFDQMDVDGDRRLQPDELQRALALLGLERELEKLVEELDTTKDGVVSFTEFLAWWRKHVIEARCVVTTSAKAWQSIITNVNPPLQLGQLVLLKVTFTFCRSCRAFEPKWRRYSEEFRDIRFVELVGNGTVGAMEFVTKELGVKVSPAFFMYRRGEHGGEIIERWTGANAERFESNVRACLEREAERVSQGA
ncbi:trx1 [Symbiodinium natans]|uniref:Trx1 protein n=1 Tax=Symbiodinium natans TaxID=878477 RepID=A0A812R3E1_9DINO|nr:trx1 [Symbiodinium natans]